MKINSANILSATVILLALILPYPSAAQTMFAPQTTTTQPKTTTTSPTLTQQPAIQNPSASPQGAIKITLPQDYEVWHTGSYQRVEWICSGTLCSSVDVGLWKDGKLAVSIGEKIATGRTAYKIPLDFPAGRYELRVTSSLDPRVGDLRNETIVPATLTITAPRKDAVLATGSTYPIFWQYKGDSGPIKIELATSAGGAPLMVAPNVPLGGAGTGQFNWQVFENLSPATNYLLKITSLASGAVTSTAGPFSVVRPSIKITSPQEGDTFLPFVYVPIRWAYVGNNFGTQVRVTVTPSVGGMSPVLDIVSMPMGENGQGGYDRWIPPESLENHRYIIRVESVQNRSIFGEVTIGSKPGGEVGFLGVVPLLQRAVVVFDTQDENKDKDTQVTVQVKTRGGKSVAEILSAAASNNDSTVFRPYTTTSLGLMVNPGIRLSECGDLALWVDIKTVGIDTWRFKVRVELFFSEGTKVVKSSAGVVERGGFYLPPAQPIYGEISGQTQILSK